MRNIKAKVARIIGTGDIVVPLTPEQLSEIASQVPPPTSIPAANIVQDLTLRMVTDGQISEWNSKQNALGYEPAQQSTVINLANEVSYKEPANINIQNHVTSAHAPSNAQKNSDITKEEIEAKLIGEISTHTHSGTVSSSPTSWGKYF